jgi:hypothetical protein
MLSKRAAEVFSSVYSEPMKWEPLLLPRTASLFLNSDILHANWSYFIEKASHLVVLYRQSDKSCFVFRPFEGNYTLLPALFTLDNTLTLLDFIGDVGELTQLESLAASSGWFTKVFWSLK